MVFSQSTPVLDVLHVMFLEKTFPSFSIWFWMNCSSQYKIKKSNQIVHSKKIISTNDKNATINKEWGYNQVSTCHPLFSFSFKNITWKTFKNGVDWENTNVFHFYVIKTLFKTYAWIRCQINYERPKNMVKKIRLRYL